MTNIEKLKNDFEKINDIDFSGENNTYYLTNSMKQLQKEFRSLRLLVGELIDYLQQASQKS